jgi:DNA-binding SARP family transcriptional activator
VNPHEIGFNADAEVWLDVAQFESHCNAAERAGSLEAQAEHYRQAVELYTADLLTDCYEDWCILERERLQHRYLRALARLLTFYAQTEQLELAAEHARRILACDPLREEVHRDLIEIYLASGQSAAALRQYRLCETQLRQELGVEPMAETRALLGRVLQASVTARAARDGGVDLAFRESRSMPSPELAPTLSSLRDAAAICDEMRGRVVDAIRLVERLASGA